LAGNQLGTLGVLSEALDQEGGENAVHFCPFIVYFCFLSPFSKRRANINNFLLTLQG
jgi:hypothetical protein